MKAAFLCFSVSRGGGGLFDCMRRLGQEMMRGSDIQVAALGLQDDNAALDLPAWPPVRAEAFPAGGLPGFQTAPGLRRQLLGMEAQVVHTHGLWSYASVAANAWQRAVGGPRVVSPHGMLDPWALGHSAWKKRLAAVLFERKHLAGAACLHALSASEAECLRAYGLRNPIAVIANGVDLPPEPLPASEPPWRKAVPADRRVLLYLGRLHPKKGLANLIRAWAALREKAQGRAWTLVIAGWDQGGHEAELRALAAGLSLDSSIDFAGPLFGEDKAAAYRHADAFILPSLSEGLPLVVLEAWSYRLPVVMTAACNLPEGFAAGAALACGLPPAELAQALGRLVEMPAAELRAMGENGRALVERQFTWTHAGRRLEEVYRWVLGRAERPDFVQI